MHDLHQARGEMFPQDSCCSLKLRDLKCPVHGEHVSTSRCWAHSVWLILRGVRSWGRSLVIVKCAKINGSVVCVCASQGFSLNISKRHDGKQRKMDIRIWSSGPRWGNAGEPPPSFSQLQQKWKRLIFAAPDPIVLPAGKPPPSERCSL